MRFKADLFRGYESLESDDRNIVLKRYFNLQTFVHFRLELSCKGNLIYLNMIANNIHGIGRKYSKVLSTYNPKHT